MDVGGDGVSHVSDISDRRSAAGLGGGQLSPVRGVGSDDMGGALPTEALRKAPGERDHAAVGDELARPRRPGAVEEVAP